MSTLSSDQGAAVAVPRKSTLVTLLAASTLTMMAGATIAPALPQIEAVYAETPNAAILTRLVLTITAIFTVIGSPFAGWFVDRYGRKNLLMFALVLYAITGTNGLYVDSITALLIGRACLGLAVACNMTAATTLIADLYRGPERTKAFGLQSAVIGAAAFVLLIVGGWLAEFGWRTPFWLYTSSLVVLLMVWVTVPEPERSTITGGKKGVVRWPVAMVVLIMAIIVVSQIAFYLWPVQLPFFLAESFGVSGVEAGIAIATASGISVITSAIYRRVRERISEMAIVAIVFASLGLANVMLWMSGSYTHVVLAMVVGGIGVGLIFPAGANWMANTVPEAVRGRAVGLVTASVFSGHFLSPLVSQPVMGAIGYANGYLVFGVVLLVFAVAASVSALRELG